MEQPKADHQSTSTERRLSVRERAGSLAALFEKWRLEDEADDRPVEAKLAEIEQFMRNVDAERPHRPLFKQYYEE